MVTVALRNRHPAWALAVPLGNKRYRLVQPGATAAVPAAALRLRATRQLLARGLLAVINDIRHVDADARQEHARRIDIAAVVRQVEQREFDRVLAAMQRKARRIDRQPAWTELVRKGWAQGASAAQIARELGGRAPTVRYWIRHLALPHSPVQRARLHCPRRSPSWRRGVASC